MNVARRVEQIVNRQEVSPDVVSLGARVIELLVLDPRTTPQGLAASLRQQTRLIRSVCRSTRSVEQIVEELIAELQLQNRLSAAARSAVDLRSWEHPVVRSRGGVSRRNSQRNALARLAARFPWPQQLAFSPIEQVPHFTQPGTLELLGQAIDELQPRLIVEVGAWLGGSTRWLLSRSPETVISIDTWLGSSEHQAGTAWHNRQTHYAALLDRLYEIFLHHCWEFRERLIALRTSSLDGFWQIASDGLQPELILLDGAHDELSVTNDLELAHELFPGARLIIDDYNRNQRWLRGLVRAVDRFALSHGLTIVEAAGEACMLVD